ncbi:MAG: DUF1697 domain-containing protein [Methanomassiliicoccaceae archaeon]|nr:DUF1697 domain-containing protein [Methanomassiliicoccaceae archaeon]
MTEYVAFLRGINVGRTKRIKINEIKSMLDRSFVNVRSYGQSGNFVFDTEMKKDDIVTLAESDLEKEFEFNVFCIVKEVNELRTAVERNPFPGASANELFFIFMSEEPSQNEDDDWSFGDDRAKRIADVIYLDCKGEYHRTKLTNTFFEKEFDIICTARNLNTVNAVLRL